MAWDLQTIRSKVQSRLQNDPFFTDTLVDEVINDAIDDLITFTRTNQQVWTVQGGSVVGLKEYRIYADWLYIDDVTYNGIPLNQITQVDWLNHGSERASASNGTPVNYYVRNNQYLVIEPAASEGGKTLNVYFVQKPADLVEDTDQPVIGRQFFQSIIHYCLYNLLLMDVSLEGQGREADAQMHWNFYLKRRSEVNFQLNSNALHQARRRSK